MPRHSRLSPETILQEIGLLPVWVPHENKDHPSNKHGLTDASHTDNQGNLQKSRAQHIAALPWEGLVQEINACQACSLCNTRKKIVPGIGDVQGPWLFVGEAPGADEDRLGEPFVGQAGQLLDHMLMAIGLKRGQGVFIANVLKCRPPNNRNPEADEVEQCRPFLERQIQLIQPKLIVALGRFAALTLLNTEATISSLRGKILQYANIPLVVTYHPAYLLRNLNDKAKAWEDLCLAKHMMQQLNDSKIPF